MGLDMYLYRLKTEGGVPSDNEKVAQLLDKQFDEKQAEYRLNVNDADWLDRYQEYRQDDSFNLMYWRKVNAIHNFFVNQVQGGNDDCEAYVVESSIIDNLLHRIKSVIEDKSKAPRLLPSQSGFFFGGTEYDDYYFDELQRTYEGLKEKLKDFDETSEFLVYTSSW